MGSVQLLQNSPGSPRSRPLQCQTPWWRVRCCEAPEAERRGIPGPDMVPYQLLGSPRSSSSSNNKTIKCFFAEAHYKPTSISSPSSSSSSLAITAVPIVEICIIIEEPLSQYRRSCVFCPNYRDILHPKGCHKFACGNDKDRFEQRLDPCCCTGMGIGKMPFTARPDMSAFLNISPK
ncbi:hypothetical protein Zm00014a_014487 [Zea mays]|uniref:Uncharacterized protein n=2 Tax=Zea mays TaxID=4577 RepID=A0A1D6GSL2_MAIZE|nr:hypothetical protein ZEAMMB73_Zm00001d014348 [Zea mays]PWZ22507.1 hypothetical protein Zm00014a_014487 [Zea mays]